MALHPVKTETYRNSTCTDAPIVTYTATYAVGIIPEVELPEWLMASGWVMGWVKGSRLQCQLHLRTVTQQHTCDKCTQADIFSIQQV